MRGGYDIVAAVTRALALRIQDAVNRVGGGLVQTQVTTRRPSVADSGQAPQINLCLFHVLPNPYLRNLHEPWRVEGREVEQPVTALDLYYLVSFIGPEHADALDPQRLLGITANALNVSPVLEPDDLRRAGAVVASTVSSIDVTPHSLTIEELTRLWSMFPQVPYQLSVCYRASAALVVADVILQPRPPSGGVAPRATAAEPLRLDAVAARDGGPAVYGSPMVATGANFAADATLSFGGVGLPIDGVSADSIAFTLEGAALRAGTSLLQVSRPGAAPASLRLAMGPLLARCRARVHPRGEHVEGRLAATLHPAVAPGQAVELDLFSADGSGVGLGFRIVKPADGRASSEIEVPVEDLPAGRYAVLAKVDGVSGRLARDAGGAFLGPFVTIGGSRAA